MAVVGKKLASAGKAVFLGAALCALAGPAMADSFRFSISSGPHGYGYGPHPHYRHHFRPYAWGPRVVFVAPPPVYYRPAPPVVYAPLPAGGPATVTPTSAPYRTADGRYCREYTSTVMVGGQPQSSYGTACQMPDGSWHIID
jgi:hypothetical protein